MSNVLLEIYLSGLLYDPYVADLDIVETGMCPGLAPINISTTGLLHGRDFARQRPLSTFMYRM